MRRKDWNRRGLKLGLGLAALFVVGLAVSGAFGQVTAFTGSTSDAVPTATDTTTAPSSGATTTEAATSTDITTGAVTYAPSIQSDQVDYSSGSTVTIAGTGWPSGDAVTVFTNDSVGNSWSDTGHVTTDADGTFSYQLTLPSWFVANYRSAATDAGGLSASTTFTDSGIFTLQGQSSPLQSPPVWISGNLGAWAELSSIPMRLDISPKNDGDLAQVDVTITYDHTKTVGGTVNKGVQSLSGFTAVGPVTLVSVGNPIVVSGSQGDQWARVVTLQPTAKSSSASCVAAADPGCSSIEFIAKLSAGAHYFTGSSLAVGASQGAGNVQIVAPAAATAPNPPDLALVKSGPASAKVGDTITYTLKYGNKGTGSSSTAQITDILPTGVTPNASSCAASGCVVSGQQVTWDPTALASLTPGAGITSGVPNGTLQLTYTATVTASTSFPFQNGASILSAEDDADITDNYSHVITSLQAATNHAPTCTNPDSDSTNENTGAAFTLHCSDQDAGDTLTYTVTSFPSHGTLHDGSSALSPTIVAVPYTLAGSQVFYVPDNNYAGSDSFGFKATDNHGADSNAATFNITVTAVNQAPVASGQSVSTAEDTGKAITLAGSDVDGDSLSFKVTSLPANGDLYVGSDATGHHVVSADLPYSLAGSGVFYVPASDYNGSDSFEFVANDGTVDSASAATVSITVTPVNDPPVAVADSASTDEDTAKAIDVLSNDSAGPSNESTQTVAVDSITVAPGHGTAVKITSGTDTGKVLYTPAADYHGSDSFTYRVCDDGSPSLCDTALVSVTVNSVNDAPAGADKTVTTAEDTPYTFTATDFGFTDTKDSPANGLTAVKVTTLPAAGSLSNNGAAVVAGGEVSAAAIGAGKLVFTPAANANGSPYTTFTFQVRDDGGTTNSGQDTDQSANTLTVNVTPVNDPPVAAADVTSRSTQYSDPIDKVTITATDDVDNAASAVSASITGWKKQADATYVTTQALGGLTMTQVGATTPASFPLKWELTGRAMVPEGTYVVRVAVTDGTTPTLICITITVTKENAYIEYSGDSFKTTASPTTNSATVNLAAIIREAGAVGAPPSSDTTLGDKLNTTQLKFTVFAFGGGQVGSPCLLNVTAGVNAGTGTAGCTATLNVGDPYAIQVQLIVNDYYIADVEDAALTVALPGTGFTTGGGWINEPNLGSRSNFGFVAKRLKNGQIQGNSLYIYRKTITANTVPLSGGTFLPAGSYNWQIKSNSWQGGGLWVNAGCNITTTPFTACTGTIIGKANIAAMNRGTGVAYGLGGNYNFRVDVTDNGEPGSKAVLTPDTYGIKVWSDSVGTYYQLYSGAQPSSTTFPQLSLNGGNIQVRP